MPMLMRRLRTILSSPHVEFMIGNALSASTTASITMGTYVMSTPWRARTASLLASRQRTRCVMSTSTTVVACGEVCLLRTMCSAMALRIGVSGTYASSSIAPGRDDVVGADAAGVGGVAGAGGGVAGGAAAAAGAAGAACSGAAA